MKKNILLVVLILCSTLSVSLANKTYADLSKRLVTAARFDQPYQPMLDSLNKVSQDVLAKELETEDLKKAFWINIYNAHIQFFLKEKPSLYEDRNDFFHDRTIMIAGKALSFDDIEHGIIRRSKSKLSLGFIPSLRVDKYERKFRTKKVDPRVHFALNCGAKSCPAVAAYDYRVLEQQMEKSTFIHLKNTTKYDETTNTINITRLFSWFRGDFGKKKKVIKFLKKYDVLADDKSPSINYNEYDWTLLLDNYIDL